MYTKAIYTKNGDVVTITEGEAKGVMAALQSGEKWIVVQGEMYSADTIARIGNHEMSAEIKRTAEADLDRKLELSGGRDLVEAKRLLQKKMTVNRVIKEETKEIAAAMSNQESENGSSEYYLSESGEKMYS